MVKFHPELDLLTEYAAGSLSLAQAACVAAHMNYCEQCRRTAGQLEDLGATLFDSLQPEAVGDVQLNAVLARLDDLPNAGSAAAPDAGRLCRPGVEKDHQDPEHQLSQYRRPRL